MLRYVFAAILTVVALPHDVRCQNPDSSSVSIVPETVLHLEAGTRAIRDLSLSSVIQVPSITVQLIATKEEKAVAAGAGLNWGSLVLDAKLKGPIAEGSSETTLLTLDSLSNSASFDVGIGWIEWSPSADQNVQEQVCSEYLRARAKDLVEAKKVDPANAPVVCDRDDFPAASYQERFLAVTDPAMRKEVCAEFARSRLLEADAVECTAASLPNVSLRHRYESAFNWGTPWQVGTRGKIGYRKFKWGDADTGNQLTDTEVPWEASFGANFLPVTNFVIGVEYRIVRGFEEQAKRSVCQSLQSAIVATNTCTELPFGRYKLKNRHMLTGLARKWIGIMAADFRISYDFENNAKGIEIPLNFVSLEGKGLTVGVATGWTSEKDSPSNGWSVRAFVGDVLNLWPGNQ
jgi:hypothetical protein